IVDLGEILIPFGEFVENNHVLVPAAYSIEWYKAEMRSRSDDLPEDWKNPSLERAMEISRQLDMPLHPKFNLFWSDLPLERLQRLRHHLLENGRWANGLVLTNEAGAKRTLEDLGALHAVQGETLVLDHYSLPLLMGLGLSMEGGKITEGGPLSGEDSLEAVSSAMGIRVMPRAMTRIGTRMARPEKAKERKMKPPPHVLFPLGLSGGAQRLVKEAASKGGAIDVDVGVRRCPVCGKNNYMVTCECGSHTLPADLPSAQRINLQSVLDRAMRRLGESIVPNIKGVQGMISRNKTPEAIEKGILRAKNGVYVFKDGTIRFDMTDLPLTHFRPGEIGLSVERARALGYVKDMHGHELESQDQLCELRVQDFISSRTCGDYLVKVARFVDEMLVKHYGLEPFYDVEKRDDLIGHMGMGLAPHTSGGVLCRFIGFMEASVGYAHPFFHAAKRRNADGDEDSCLLLLDALINFSRSFLPDKRGGLMDAPLVLTTRLDPNEIDKEAHNIDVMSRYPIEFYEATLRNADPKSLEKELDFVSNRIGSVLQYENFGFTLDTDDIAAGPTVSAYKTLGSMDEKTQLQLELARKIRAVDEKDVAERLLSNHFLPDMMGNLRKFSSQKVRCTKCGSSYRRIPLAGKCKCGHKLILTVHEGNIRKYLDMSKRIAKEFEVSPYVSQRIDILELSIDTMFENKKVKHCTLGDFDS
ncbi:MAG: DNA polymerase II large subunit, partial [Thermoplasmata archaeon]|nr:DNA polymerase II large subunit [Thermoplasmata archaeon]